MSDTHTPGPVGNCKNVSAPPPPLVGEANTKQSSDSPAHPWAVGTLPQVGVGRTDNCLLRKDEQLCQV